MLLLYDAVAFTTVAVYYLAKYSGFGYIFKKKKIKALW